MAVTTNKGVIKMPAAGDTVTMHVAKCEVVQGQFDEQVKFTDTRGDALFLPRKSADRQLLRCGFGEGEGEAAVVFYGDVDGTTLVFTRDPNEKMPAKPYWGIRRVVQEEDDTPRPSLKAAAQAEAERVRKAKGLPPDEDDGGNMGPMIPGLDDVPPPSDEDYPYAEDDGMPPQKPAPVPAIGISAKESAINDAYRRAWAVAIAVQGDHATPDTIQAGAATLLIQMSRAGIC